MLFINISADLSRGIWLQLNGEQHGSAAPHSQAELVLPEVTRRRGGVAAWRASAASNVTSGGLFLNRKVKSLGLWYTNIVAWEEHLVSTLGTTYSMYYSLHFPHSPIPMSIPRLCGAETLLHAEHPPPCPSSQHFVLSLVSPASVSPNPCSPDPRLSKSIFLK